MAELTPGQHQAKRTAKIKGLPYPGGPPPMTPPAGLGGIKGAPVSPRMPPPGMGQPQMGGGVSPAVGPLPTRQPPAQTMTQPQFSGNLGPSPFAPGPGNPAQTYDLASTMAGIKSGGFRQGGGPPPMGRQFGGGLGSGFNPSPVVGDAGMLARKNQLQSQALAPQFG